MQLSFGIVGSAIVTVLTALTFSGAAFAQTSTTSVQRVGTLYQDLDGVGLLIGAFEGIDGERTFVFITDETDFENVRVIDGLPEPLLGRFYLVTGVLAAPSTPGASREFELECTTETVIAAQIGLLEEGSANELSDTYDMTPKVVSQVAMIEGDLKLGWQTSLARNGYVGETEFAPISLVTPIRASACDPEDNRGNFYCQSKNLLQIDLKFMRDLKCRQQQGAGHYAIAHLAGHQAQKLLFPEQVSEIESTALSREERVRALIQAELNADCLAGVLMSNVPSLKEELGSDGINSAIQATAHVGDDFLQLSSGTNPAAEYYTHATQELRSQWVQTGWQNQDIYDCEVVFQLDPFRN